MFTDIPTLTTPALVRDFAALKVWFAVTNGTTARGPEGDRKHARLVAVVDELRARGVLD